MSKPQAPQLRERMARFRQAVDANDREMMALAYCSIRRHGNVLFDQASALALRKVPADIQLGLDRVLKEHPIPQGADLLEHLERVRPSMVDHIPSLRATKHLRLCLEANALIAPYDAEFGQLDWRHGLETVAKSNE